MKATIGVLGGMGPWATVEFLSAVLSRTEAHHDRDYARMIVDVNTQIPSRTRHVLFGEESPVAGMIDSCRRLAAYPVDVIAIPCNSACAFLDEVRPFVDVELIDTVEVTARRLHENVPGVARCAVFGGRVTYHKDTYAPFLESLGIEYLRPTESHQMEIESIIEDVKLHGFSDSAEKRLVRLTTDVARECRADAVVLGCTELRVHQRREELGAVSVQSSLDALADCVAAVSNEETHES